MVGSQSCRASGLEGDLRATTFTGTNNNHVVCDIGASQDDIRHYVQLENLLVYETRIKCTRQITSKPRFIKFDSPNPDDTEEEWTADCVLGNYGKHTFSHAKVISEQPGNGDQTIKVSLEIDRLRQRATHNLASLQITVLS